TCYGSFHKVNRIKSYQRYRLGYASSPLNNLRCKFCLVPIHHSFQIVFHEKIRSRSEEHTSELQSRFDLVCRLLLEKKNKKLNKSCRPPEWPAYSPHSRSARWTTRAPPHAPPRCPSPSSQRRRTWWPSPARTHSSRA